VRGHLYSELKIDISRKIRNDWLPYITYVSIAIIKNSSLNKTQINIWTNLVKVTEIKIVDQKAHVYRNNCLEKHTPDSYKPCILW